MDRLKAEMGRAREKKKVKERRAEERRSEKRKSQNPESPKLVNLPNLVNLLKGKNLRKF